MGVPLSPLVLRVDPEPQPLSQQQASLRADAQGNYERLRQAYMQVTRDEPGNEVAFAMIGADMDRAYARLQRLLGRPAPITHRTADLRARRAKR